MEHQLRGQTLSHWHPRLPAFTGLLPTPAQYLPTDTQTERFFGELGLNGRIEKLTTPHKGFCGHYRVATAKEVFFLKVIDPVEITRQKLADELAAYALSRGARVLPPGQWKESSRGYFVGLYPYIDARMPKPTLGDAASIGTALADLHIAWESFPGLDSIRVASLARMHILSERHKQVVSGVGPLGPAPERFRLFASLFFEPFEGFSSGQIIHGDLNLGNILLDRHTNQPLFIDFETATVSYLPARFDIAMVIHRLSIVSVQDSDSIARVSAKMMNSYYDNLRGHTDLYGSSDRLKADIKWLCLRNLCLLAQAEASGRVASKSEWFKFLDAADSIDNDIL